MIGKRVYFQGDFGTVVADRNNGMYDIELDPANILDDELPGKPSGQTKRCILREEFELVEVKSDLSRALFDLGKRMIGEVA